MRSPLKDICNQKFHTFSISFNKTEKNFGQQQQGPRERPLMMSDFRVCR